MGDWSFAPWGNDAAADWFQRFWKAGDFAPLFDEIEDFDPKQERYDELRAAAYLLQTLGRAYVWPAPHLARLKPLLERTIAILRDMLAPPDEDWGFLDMWGSDPDVIREVQEQIAALQARLAELA